MEIREFRRVLKLFAQQARPGEVLSESTESKTLADLAEQLDSRIGLNERVIKSSTISSAPSGACPCCGK
jgi:hypothetical protein